MRSKGHLLRETELDGHPAVVLACEDRALELTVVPGAGMVGARLTQGGRDLLHDGDGLAAWTGRGATFGIPLLHPWANQLERLAYAACGQAVLLDPQRMPLTFDGGGLPIHGLLHATPRWEVLRTYGEPGAAGISARYDAVQDPDVFPGFPFPHVLDLTITLRSDLVTFELVLTATGEQPVPVSFGWHPYLRLPGVPREEWRLHLPVVTQALLDGRSLPTGQTRPAPLRDGLLAGRGLDDFFPLLDEPAEFVVAGGEGALRARFEEGFPCAQVYTPPGADFICFEPMTAPTDALRRGGASLRVVPPGGTYVSRWSLLVEGRPGA